MSYLFVVTGRNCASWAEACLTSIAAQPGDWRCVVVDDASEDGTVVRMLPVIHSDRRFALIHRAEPVGIAQNQWEAVQALEPRRGDVLVWVDLDDRLAHEKVLLRLDREYDTGALVTYGSYRPDPPSTTCPRVWQYPVDVLRKGTLRRHFSRLGTRFNHLRTVSWEVFRHFTSADFKDDDGQWFAAGLDYAVMIPAIELAGTRTRYIPDVLYVYTSDNPNSEWRVRAPEANSAHAQVLRRTARRPL